jgi:hypothetical protein
VGRNVKFELLDFTVIPRRLFAHDPGGFIFLRKEENQVKDQEATKARVSALTDALSVFAPQLTLTILALLIVSTGVLRAQG